MAPQGLVRTQKSDSGKWNLFPEEKNPTLHGKDAGRPNSWRKIMVLTRINSNVSAINATRNLNKSGTDLAQSLERLSSGLRINRASDDASGLFISEKLRSQIRGLNRAAQNAQDAISLSNTAEGALDETTGILQRIRELAIQAANSGGNDQESIRAAQDEIDLSIQEINRIGNDTQFSTRKLLNGDNAATATMTTGFGASATEGPATNTLQTGTHYLTITEVTAGSVASSDLGNVIAATTDVTASTFESGSYTITVSNAVAEVLETQTSERFAVGAATATWGTALTTINSFGATAIFITDDMVAAGTTANGTAFTLSHNTLAADTLGTLATALQNAINNADATTTADNVTVTVDASGQLVIAEIVGNTDSELAFSGFGIARNKDGGTGTIADIAGTNDIQITTSQDGTANTATISIAGGTAQTVTGGTTGVTLYGQTPSDPTIPAAQITLNLGTLTNGTDTLAITAAEYSATLDAGNTVTFQNGDEGVRFKSGEGAGFSSGEVLLVDFGLTVTEGTVLVDVENDGLSFHIGANQNQSITMAISDVRATNLGDLRTTQAHSSRH